MLMLSVNQAARPPLVAVAVLGLLAGLWLLVAPPAHGGHNAGAERIEGVNRYDTAAQIALDTFASADVAFLATGEDYPDALAASFAAGVGDGPVLLAHADVVPDVTLDALGALGVGRVVLMGGEAALSAQVEARLERAGFTVERSAGVNRYDTAAVTADRWGRGSSIGTLGGDRTAILASGETFADALSAGPVAAGANLPLLLTTSEESEATRLAANTMDQIGIERVIVAGGSDAVGATVVEYLREEGFKVERWQGHTRAGTGATIAANARQRLGFDVGVTLLARGDAFPDALATGIHGGKAASPILLALTPETLGEETAAWIDDVCEEIDVVRAIGGDQAVSQDVHTEAGGIAACHDIGPIYSTEERSSEGFPGTPDAAQLTDADGAGHDETDRVVLEFAGEEVEWDVAWTDEALQQPSGQPVDVEGDSYLEVTVNASADWMDGGYGGPDRVAIDGDVANEAVLTEDWEGYITWTVGLDREAPFAVEVLDDPQRLLVDFADA